MTVITISDRLCNEFSVEVRLENSVSIIGYKNNKGEQVRVIRTKDEKDKGLLYNALSEIEEIVDETHEDGKERRGYKDSINWSNRGLTIIENSGYLSIRVSSR